MQGYIKLWRKIKEQSYYGKPNYVALWVHILLSANHKEKKILWNGEDLIIKQGQFITGRKELAKATGIPESTCEDILNSLETRHQIRQQKTTKFRIITILNWSTYQTSDIKSDNKATTKRHKQE